MQFQFSQALAASVLRIDLVLSTMCFVAPTTDQRTESLQQTEELFSKERSQSGINGFDLWLLFAASFPSVTGKQEHRDKYILIANQPFSTTNLLTKAETRGTLTRKAFLQVSEKGVWLCVNNRNHVSAANWNFYAITLFHINRPFQNSFIQLLITGRSKKMKGQLARPWTASESQDMQAFLPRKYNAEILPALLTKVHSGVWKSNPKNLGQVPVWGHFLCLLKTDLANPSGPSILWFLFQLRFSPRLVN